MSEGVDTIEAPAGETSSETTLSTEARARAQGWRPKDEYKGPPERWNDAETFLKIAEEYLPVARQQNRVLEDRLASANGKIDALKGELGEVKQVLTEFREFASKADKRAYEKARKDLLAERDVAVAHADAAGFKAADEKLAELERETPKVAADSGKETKVAAEKEKTLPLHPAVVSWIEANPWFSSDPVLNQMAKAIDGRLQSLHPALAIPDRLQMVAAEVKKRFPENFENSSREAPSSVSAPSGGGNAGKKAPKHSYENLPSEARKACDKFVKSIPGFKVEDYVRDYDWGDA
jgi:hypothetical protein